MRPILLGYALACVALLGVACTDAPDEPTPAPTVAPATAITQVQQTPKPTPPSMATPTSVAPTPAPTADGPPNLIALEALNIRSGPGIEYPIVGTLSKAGDAFVVGRAADASWYRIECPAALDTPECWVIGDDSFVRIESKQGAAAVAVVPTPLVPTATTAAAATLCRSAVPSGWVRYIVAAGDSVWSIAVRHGITMAELRAVNCLGEALVVGATIYVRPKSTVRRVPPWAQPAVAGGAVSGSAVNSGSGAVNSGSNGGGSRAQPPTSAPATATEKPPEGNSTSEPPRPVGPDATAVPSTPSTTQTPGHARFGAATEPASGEAPSAAMLWLMAAVSGVLAAAVAAGSTRLRSQQSASSGQQGN